MSWESGVRTATGTTTRSRSTVKPGHAGPQIHDRPPDKYIKACYREPHETAPSVPGMATQTGPSYSSRCYTPSKGVISYLDTLEGVPSFELLSEVRDWHNDCWGGLLNPPANLKIEHFIRSLPESVPNGEAQRRICLAENNLYTANVRHQLMTPKSYRGKKPFSFVIPYPEIVPDIDTKQALDQLPRLVHQFNDQGRVFSESMNLMKTAIQGLTTICEAAKRDSTQSTKSFTNDLIEQIRKVCGSVPRPDIRLPPVHPFPGQVPGTRGFVRPGPSQPSKCPPPTKQPSPPLAPRRKL